MESSSRVVCMSRNHTLLVTLVILSLLLVTCGGKPTPEPTQPPAAQSAPPTAQLTQPPAAQPTKQPAARPTPPPATVAPAAVQPSPVASSAAVRDTPFGKIADPSALSSARARSFLEVRKKDGTPPSGGMRTTMEWVKEPPAQHITVGEGEGTIETIIIGDRTWVKMGQTWMESSPDQAQEEASTGREDYLPEQDVVVKPLGDDTVNGVHCQCQSYSGKFTVTVPLMPDQTEEKKVTFNVKGEMCIADQRGLPPVVVREKSEIDGNLLGLLFAVAMGGQPTPEPGETTYWERELYDINVPITIQPPEGAVEMPAAPATVAALVMPTRAAQPPAVPALVNLTPVPELQACFEGFPSYPNAEPDPDTAQMATIIAMGLGSPSEGRGYKTADPAEQVQAFFETEAPSAGWELGPFMQGASMQYWGKEKFIIILNVFPPSEDRPQTTFSIACGIGQPTTP